MNCLFCYFVSNKASLISRLSTCLVPECAGTGAGSSQWRHFKYGRCRLRTHRYRITSIFCWNFVRAYSLCKQYQDYMWLTSSRSTKRDCWFSFAWRYQNCWPLMLPTVSAVFDFLAAQQSNSFLEWCLSSHPVLPVRRAGELHACQTLIRSQLIKSINI